MCVCLYRMVECRLNLDDDRWGPLFCFSTLAVACCSPPRRGRRGSEKPTLCDKENVLIGRPTEGS